MRTGVGERWIVLSNYWIGKITRLNGKLGDEQLQQSLSRRELAFVVVCFGYEAVRASCIRQI